MSDDNRKYLWQHSFCGSVTIKKIERNCKKSEEEPPTVGLDACVVKLVLRMLCLYLCDLDLDQFQF